jgi:hypothetical protein
MHYEGKTFGVLQIFEGYSSQKRRPDARPSGTGYFACIEQSSFGGDFSHRIWKKSHYIRIGSISSNGTSYRPQDSYSGSYGWLGQPDGIGFF